MNGEPMDGNKYILTIAGRCHDEVSVDLSETVLGCCGRPAGATVRTLAHTHGENFCQSRVPRRSCNCILGNSMYKVLNVQQVPRRKTLPHTHAKPRCQTEFLNEASIGYSRAVSGHFERPANALCVYFHRVYRKLTIKRIP